MPAELADQDRRGVGADREERAVTDGELAIVAGQDIQPEDRDRIGQGRCDLVGGVIGDEQRDEAAEDDQANERHTEFRREWIRAKHSRLHSLDDDPAEKASRFKHEDADDQDEGEGQAEFTTAWHILSGPILQHTDNEAARDGAAGAVNPAK